jgi:hypothetical protein
VQQRDAHRLALGDVGPQATALAEQLGAAMAQGHPDHPGTGDEGGLEATLGRAGDRQCRQALDRPLADQKPVTVG